MPIGGEKETLSSITHRQGGKTVCPREVSSLSAERGGKELFDELFRIEYRVEGKITYGSGIFLLSGYCGAGR